MNEDAAVFLVEIFDFTGFRIKFHGASDACGEFLVGKLDARDLWTERGGDKGTEKGVVGVLLVVDAVRGGDG